MNTKMTEQLLEESDSKRLLYSALLAFVIHGVVAFTWSRFAVESNAYAIGSPGRIQMVLTTFSPSNTTVEPVLEQPKPVVVPSEFKKKVEVKRPEKKKEEIKPENLQQNSQVVSEQTGTNQIQGGEQSGTSSAEPDYLNNPPPSYPNESRRKHEEGVVLIFAKINTAGKVDDLQIQRSSGFERLDDAALKAVRDWKFKPARFAGVSIESNVEIPVRFSLR